MLLSSRIRDLPSRFRNRAEREEEEEGRDEGHGKKSYYHRGAEITEFETGEGWGTGYLGRGFRQNLSNATSLRSALGLHELCVFVVSSSSPWPVVLINLRELELLVMIWLWCALLLLLAARF